MPERHPHARRLTALTLVACAGVLVSCGEEKDAREAVRSASIEFRGVASGDQSTFRDQASKSYSAIEGMVSGVAGDGSGYEEAAAVSLAQAKLGEAAQASIELSGVETESLQRARVIRASLSEWMALSAIAKAASTFDPSEDLADLEGLVQLRTDDADRYTAQQREINGRIADLERQIAGLRAKSTDERRLAGQTELGMTGVSATRAAELAAEVREHTLRADQFELEAVRIEGRLGQLRPTAAEIGLNVSNAENQIAMLRRSQDELRARANASKEDAAEARSAAAQAQDRLTALGESLRDFRNQRVRTLTDAVIAKLRAAEQALTPARGALVNSAAATRAAIKETTGSVYARSATGHAEAASIFSALADAGIPGGFDQDAESERTEAGRGDDAANEAFRAVASAMRSIRAAAEARDKLEQAAARFDALAGVQPEPEPADDSFGGDEPMDEPPADDPDAPMSDEG